MESWKTVVIKILPAPVLVSAMAVRRKVLPKPSHILEREAFRKLGEPGAVMQGPFRGMKYLPVAWAGSTLNKVMGVYELELAPSVEAMIAADGDVVVDVGTAEGYYAVGMAMRLPKAQIHGYDISKVARRMTRRMAEINGVSDRVTLGGWCSPEELERVLAPAKRPQVVSDCEGGEDALLDPAKVPTLKRTTILVELHDMEVPGVSERIRARFSPTHHIEEFHQRPRRLEDAPPGSKLTPAEADQAMREGRDDRSFWFMMTPRPA